MEVKKQTLDPLGTTKIPSNLPQYVQPTQFKNPYPHNHQFAQQPPNQKELVENREEKIGISKKTLFKWLKYAGYVIVIAIIVVGAQYILTPKIRNVENVYDNMNRMNRHIPRPPPSKPKVVYEITPEDSIMYMTDEMIMDFFTDKLLEDKTIYMKQIMLKNDSVMVLGLPESMFSKRDMRSIMITALFKTDDQFLIADDLTWIEQMKNWLFSLQYNDNTMRETSFGIMFNPCVMGHSSVVKTFDVHSVNDDDPRKQVGIDVYKWITVEYDRPYIENGELKIMRYVDTFKNALAAQIQYRINNLNSISFPGCFYSTSII